MQQPVLRVLSYLPNPRVWKALIAAELCGVRVETVGDAPGALPNWLWDFDARPLREEERTGSSPHARTSRRGFTGTLYKTDAFLLAHPFGTVPAAFSPDGSVGIFESNSILRAVVRAAGEHTDLYGRNGYEASRIDSFLDASLGRPRSRRLPRPSLLRSPTLRRGRATWCRPARRRSVGLHSAARRSSSRKVDARSSSAPRARMR